jgi:8-oxo-dGTP pyrophosphatase MutT (NUDIX family)
MKEEKSAGGIVIKKILSVWNVLVITDMSGTGTFAKGLTENGENYRNTAIREVAEETGVTGLEFVRDFGEIRYSYRKNGLINKTVKYILFKTDYNGPLKPQKEEGVKEVVWMPLERAMDRIGYRKTNVPLLKETVKYLSNIYGI